MVPARPRPPDRHEIRLRRRFLRRLHRSDRGPAAALLPAAGRGVAGRRITTIEGLGAAGLHAVQKAWIEEDVAQCGYCQAGQILAAVALLEREPDPAPEDIDTITNLCRCGTYVRIRRAIARAARDLKAAK